MMLTSCVVELGLTGLTSTSRSIRTTCAKSFALLRSSDSVLSVRPHILCSRVRLRRNGVRFPKRPHDSFRVPSGVPVQRSISERDVSHPRTVFYFYFRILIGCLGILGLLRRRMVVVSHLFRPQRF